MLDLPVEIRRYLSQFQRYKYFRFRGHIAVSGCRSMLPSISDTFFELYMLVNSRHAVEISMLSRLVSDSGFDGHFRSSIIIGTTYRYCFRARRGRKLQTDLIRLEFWWYLSHFLRYKYFRFRRPYCLVARRFRNYSLRNRHGRFCLVFLKICKFDVFLSKRIFTPSATRVRKNRSTARGLKTMSQCTALRSIGTIISVFT